MILVIDVGNTNIVLGCFDGEKLVFKARLSTNISETVEEYAIKLNSLFSIKNIDADKFDGAIISSVVPALIDTMSEAVYIICGKKPMTVGPGIKTGFNIKIDNPGELGADMVVGTAGSIAKYPLPQIVCDLGTAITVSVIDKTAIYRGGAILCGIKTAYNALSNKTAQLPQINLTAPPKAIGTNTVDCMRTGAVYGTSAMIDGLVKRFEDELGEKATVILTGGFGEAIAKHCECNPIVDNDLLLDGLRIIYYKNKQR